MPPQQISAFNFSLIKLFMDLISWNPFPVISDQFEGQPQVEDHTEANSEKYIDVAVYQKISLNHFE